MKAFLLAIFISLGAVSGFAQSHSLKGSLKDSLDNTPLIGANVILSNVREPAKKHYAVVDANGNFVVEGLEKTFYKLEITFVGYSPINKFIRIDETITDLGSLIMSEDSEILDEVTIEGETVSSVQKGDTTAFNAEAFKTNPDANTEDLIRKMPGITVENGSVQAQGEDVGKVLVDGQEFFGNDATLALRSLPAEVVERIEVFDRLSEQSQFTGFDDGNTTKTINIVTKSTLKTSQFGKLYAGYGTDDRYIGGGYINLFNDDRRVSFIGLTNNISEQNFSTQDLLGVVGTSNQRRGFQGGGGFGGGRGGGFAGGGGFRGNFGGTSNFLVGQQNGITTTNSFGVNYMDNWGEKVSITASYFFNMTNNDNLQSVAQEYFLENQASQFYDETSFSRSDNMNHRINARIEYTINDKNSLIWTPRLSFQDFESGSQVSGVNYLDAANLISDTDNQNNSSTFGYNINSNLLLRHQFAKRGRTISVNIRTDFNNREGDSFLASTSNFYARPTPTADSILQQSENGSDGYNLSANLVYTEPLGQSGQLQLNYNTLFSRNNANQYTYDFNFNDQLFSMLDTALSNVYMNDYMTHRAGASYRLRKGRVFFTLGAAFQNANLVGDQEFPVEISGDKSFNNILPNAMFMYTMSRNSNLRVFYRTSSNAPSINQLQNVINNSNPLQLSTGNPDLDQQVNHIVIGRFSRSNPDRNTTFFALAFLRFAESYLGNSTLIADRDIILSDGTELNRGSQLTMPININGYWSGRGLLTYGFPLRFIKSNLNINSSYNYSRTPGIINTEKNISDSHTFSEGLTLSSNISEKIDFTLSYSANYNIVENSIRPELDNNYFYHTAGFSSTLTFWKGIVLRNDLNNYLYRGLSDEFNQDFLIWNLSVAKRLFKQQNGEIRLGIFDVLKQNRSIVRNVTETYVEDVSTEVLRQYFMLTFTYNLRAFGQKKTNSGS